jgi:hypothetical protein
MIEAMFTVVEVNKDDKQPEMWSVGFETLELAQADCLFDMHSCIAAGSEVDVASDEGKELCKNATLTWIKLDEWRHVAHGDDTSYYVTKVRPAIVE